MDRIQDCWTPGTGVPAMSCTVGAGNQTQVLNEQLKSNFINFSISVFPILLFIYVCALKNLLIRKK